MARVLGIGGVFFKSKDPGTFTTWFREVLGLEVQDWGGILFTPEAMAAHPGAAPCSVRSRPTMTISRPRRRIS
jgi:hypothetical protein